MTDLSITLEVLPKQSHYPSRIRNNLESREWHDHDGVSLRLIHVTPIPKGRVLWGCKKTRKARIAINEQLKQDASFYNQYILVN